MALSVSKSYAEISTHTVDFGSVDTGRVVTANVTGKFVPARLYKADAPALAASGLFIVGSVCTTAGTLVLSLGNLSGGTVDPAATEVRVVAL